VVADDLHFAVELQQVRHAGGDVEFHDFLIRHVLHELDDAADTVAVGHDEHLLVLAQGLHDVDVPQRDDALGGVHQRFGGGAGGLELDVLVADVEFRVARVVIGQRLGLHVVAAAPLGDLLLAVDLHGLLLVLSLQGAVVLLVQPPGLIDGQP